MATTDTVILADKLGLNGTKPLFCQISRGKVGEALSQAGTDHFEHLRRAEASRGGLAGF